MYLLICVPHEGSDQNFCSLIIVFIVSIKELCILGYPTCAQWKWQAYLNLSWALMSKSTFFDVAVFIGQKINFVCICLPTHQSPPYPKSFLTTWGSIFSFFSFFFWSLIFSKKIEGTWYAAFRGAWGVVPSLWCVVQSLWCMILSL